VDEYGGGSHKPCVHDVSSLMLYKIGNLCSDTRSSLPITNTCNGVLVLPVWPWNFNSFARQRPIECRTRDCGRTQFRSCKAPRLEAAASWSKLYSDMCNSNWPLGWHNKFGVW